MAGVQRRMGNRTPSPGDEQTFIVYRKGFAADQKSVLNRNSCKVAGETEAELLWL